MPPHLWTYDFIDESRTKLDPLSNTVPHERAPASATREGLIREEAQGAPARARGAARVQEELIEPERIQLALMTAASLGGRGLLRRSGRATRLVLEQVDLGSRSLHWRCPVPAERGGSLPYELEVASYNSIYRMHLQEGAWEEDRLKTPLPERLVYVRHRLHRRVPPPPSTRLHLPLPSWPGREREILDVSFGGLGVRLLPGDRLEPGSVLQSCVLVTEDGRVLSAGVRDTAIVGG